eukprot:TRINITY_DN8399_c0_g1_i5.p1 TRINITY_DN8399_c0_g1~~TRINITY_DN8399_c0_g1_i5.p1  ORF type:complete len:287 (+),score=40.30 TRINITY_DN8399_c0_g1_i5:149-1009(+)
MPRSRGWGCRVPHIICALAVAGGFSLLAILAHLPELHKAASIKRDDLARLDRFARLPDDFLPRPQPAQPATQSSAIDRRGVHKGGEPWSNEYLVFTSAGNLNVVPSWLECGPPRFDLWVSFYGDDNSTAKTLQKLAQRFWVGVKGKLKFMILRDTVIAEPHALDPYSAVLVMDDDTMNFPAREINVLFDLLMLYNLTYAGPSQDPTAKCSHRPHMAHHNGTLLRYDGSERVDIEMNAPVFQKDALVDYLLHGYDTRLKGWGTDVLFRCGRRTKMIASKFLSVVVLS